MEHREAVSVTFKKNHFSPCFKHIFQQVNQPLSYVMLNVPDCNKRNNNSNSKKQQFNSSNNSYSYYYAPIHDILPFLSYVTIILKKSNSLNFW